VQREAALGEPLVFVLPEELEAHEPAEARGLERDEVRLMVSYPGDDSIVHTRFTQLPAFLNCGDVLVVNTSATINAAVRATRPNGEPIELHLSQRLPDGHWVVELRRMVARGAAGGMARGMAPLLTAVTRERLALEAGGTVTLVAPYRPNRPEGWTSGLWTGETRLWVASVEVEGEAVTPKDSAAVLRYLDRHGFPIRYAYVPESWPLAYYQTMFAEEPGSAEMPSAGRAFTPRVVEALTAKGVVIVPLLLHTGVASLEAHEPPYPEFFRVGGATALAVNDARRRGCRVVAVGTTVVRALETVASPEGVVSTGEGWTELVITPERGLYAVDGLLTGFHEPRASHLAMLEALAGRDHLEIAYDVALREGYQWHEFGDGHLLLRAAC
jgi:S-adenosylmethionine:tRNA ribosyltransferase-isomerase